jgi:hypothetical protein
MTAHDSMSIFCVIPPLNQYPPMHSFNSSFVHPYPSLHPIPIPYPSIHLSFHAFIDSCTIPSYNHIATYHSIRSYSTPHSSIILCIHKFIHYPSCNHLSPITPFDIHSSISHTLSPSPHPPPFANAFIHPLSTLHQFSPITLFDNYPSIPLPPPFIYPLIH